MLQIISFAHQPFVLSELEWKQTQIYPHRSSSRNRSLDPIRHQFQTDRNPIGWTNAVKLSQLTSNHQNINKRVLIKHKHNKQLVLISLQ